MGLTFQHGKFVGINDECLTIILGHDIKDDSCNNQEQTCNNKHYRSNERWEAGDHASVHEVDAYATAKNKADDTNNQTESSKERQWLVLADHAEDGAHYLDAVSDGIKFADGTFRTVAVLNRHLVKTEIVVQRMNSHFGFDLKTTGQHWVGLYKSEGERSVASHNVGHVSAEQSIDGSAYEPIAEVVEGAFVFLEVRGAQTIANHHVVAFENLVDHGWCCVSWVRIVAVRHDVYVGINVFEHGSNDIALALTWLLTYDSAF